MAPSARGDSMHSNASMLERLSCNIFITNFPSNLTSKELWNTCAKHGTVLDVYIPKKLSKQGKPFAFARFNRVSDVDMLIKNLRSVWLGNFHLYANVARSNRVTKTSTPQNASKVPAVKSPHTSFVNVVKGTGAPVISNAPVMVLERGTLNYDGNPVLVGCVKDFKSLLNIHNICSNEGFWGFKTSYLRGFWVLLEFDSLESCEKFRKHDGINSWFSTLNQWSADFEIQDRVVWLDVEGTPLHGWSHANFKKIAGRWGELVYLDTSNVPNKYSMRLCVKTRVQHLIAESFKVTIDGKVFIVRAKEVTGWIPEFDEGKHNHSEDGSDNNSIPDWVNSDEEVVQDTFQPHVNVATHEETPGKEDESPKKVSEQKDSPFGDPFGLEDLIYHLEEVVANSPTSDRASVDHTSVQDKGVDNTTSSNDGVNDFVLKDNSSNSTNHVSSSINHDHVDSMAQATKHVNGFSILERFQDFITIGQAMGYGLGGKEKKDWVKSLCHSYQVNFLSLQETKMVSLDVFVIRAFWGNIVFDFATSSARGRSGGILCVWDKSVFQKKRVSSTDHCLCVEGTWLASNSDLLFMSVYSPQDLVHKRTLWSYMAGIINRWHGEVIIMGDFNEVRYASKRHGSVFHATNAAEFNTFIANSHLNDIPLGSYSFTWSDKYASKMSKLDRFLVSNGILNLFSNLSGLILHRHISDHRPILLKESHVDYGPTPFRLFHSWFLDQDFSSVVEYSWNNDVVTDTNVMILLKNKSKSMKVRLKAWSIEKKSVKEHERKLLHDAIIDIDSRLDKGTPSIDDMSNRVKYFHDLQVLDNNDSVDLVQKAKIKWAIEGDENTKFYHEIVNKKRHHLAIKGVLVDGDWVDIPSRVKVEFYSHFAKRFSTPDWTRVPFDTQFPRRLDVNQACDLECEVTNEEIKRAVWDCGSDKSPGPDGFTFEFFNEILVYGVRPSEVHSMAECYGCLANNLPFTYLGVKVGANMSRVNSWNEVPEGVLSHLESLRNSFFLGADLEDKKITWVCWRKVTASKHLGGLWVNGAIDCPPRYVSSVWNKIIKATFSLKSKGVDLLQYCKIVIGNGSYFKFWHDVWFADVRLKYKFNRCFKLDLQQHASIDLKLQNTDFASSFRRRPRSGIEEAQFHELSNMLASVTLSSAKDRWSWSLVGSGVFSVKSAREEIDKRMLITSPSPTRGSKVLPIKINVFLWQMVLKPATIFSSNVRWWWICSNFLGVGRTFSYLLSPTSLPGRRGLVVLDFPSSKSRCWKPSFFPYGGTFGLLGMHLYSL
ncbi:RNA-directed DNA polymerase, eukaryota [Tanacetum coccineum]